MTCYAVNYMDHYIWLHISYIVMIGITCITFRLHLLLHTYYILHYMSCYTGYYMAHYMTSYIIMIGITWSWISLHELHGGYIICLSLLRTHYNFYYMAFYIVNYMEHYITNYIIMIDITWITWRLLSNIFCYTHITYDITYCITWPVTCWLHG